MGYRSQVRSLIYGPKDKVDAFILMNTMILQSSALKDGDFIHAITRYDTNVSIYNTGMKTFITQTVNVLDLYGDNWKWHDSYPDVQAWVKLLSDADEFGLNTEFLRIGEENNDIEHDISGDEALLSVSRDIVDNITKSNSTPLKL